VLAHELGHHVHKDIPLQIIVQFGINMGGFFLASRLLQSTYTQMSLSHPADPAGLPLLVALFGMIGLILMPGTNAFSRWRENLADAYALQATQKPLAFASAMTRLANQNLAELDPAAWVVWLLYSHPPLRERIRRAQRFHETM
jgi:STE24 endopeptidase